MKRIFILLLVANRVDAQQPMVNSFTPMSGPIGTSVTISGSGFNPTVLTNDIVYFGDARANVISASSSLLTVTVPAGATYKPISVTTNGLTAYSIMPFVVTFPGGTSSFTGSSFAPYINYTPGGDAYNLFSGDLDGDGKPDIAVTHGADISIYRNTGDSGTVAFANPIDIPVANGMTGIKIDDMNGDGKPDIIASNYSAGEVYILINAGSCGTISFPTITSISVPTSTLQISVQDIDMDGKPDIITSGDDEIDIYRNTSIGSTVSFSAPITYSTSSFAYHTVIGDFDGDGIPDIAVSVNGVKISIFRNTSTVGNISLAPAVDFATTGPGGDFIAAADYNNDGKLDLAITEVNSNVVSIYKNTSAIGSLSFAPKIDYATPVGAEGVVASDMDGDGKLDLIIASFDNSGTVAILKNTTTAGNISFAPYFQYGTGTHPYTYDAIAADFDGDGVPDIAVTDRYVGEFSVLRNSISTPLIITHNNTNINTPTLGLTSSIAACYDHINVITVLGSGYANPAYQWYKKSSTGIWQAIPNANASFYADYNPAAGTNWYEVGIEDGTSTCSYILDSIVANFNKPLLPTTIVDTTICAGQSYLVHTATGIYKDTLANTAGCDSIIVTSNITVVNCNSSCNNWFQNTAISSGARIGDLGITGNQLTVEAEFNSSVPLSTTGYDPAIVSKHSDPPDCNFVLRTDVAELSTTTNGLAIAQAPCMFEPNKTYHVAMVYDGSTLKFYRDGFLMSSVPQSGNMVANSWLTTIGEKAGGTPSESLIGYINEVRIWNVARTQAQLRAYMNTSLPNPATQPGLLAYYTFNDLLNKQGNAAYNGTLFGSSSINNTNPQCSFFADSCCRTTVSTIDTTLCQGQSYQGHNTTGSFNDTLTNATGCDSIITINLTINNACTASCALTNNIIITTGYNSSTQSSIPTGHQDSGWIVTAMSPDMQNAFSNANTNSPSSPSGITVPPVNIGQPAYVVQTYPFPWTSTDTYLSCFRFNTMYTPRPAATNITNCTMNLTRTFYVNGTGNQNVHFNFIVSTDDVNGGVTIDAGTPGVIVLSPGGVFGLVPPLTINSTVSLRPGPHTLTIKCANGEDVNGIYYTLPSGADGQYNPFGVAVTGTISSTTNVLQNKSCCAVTHSIFDTTICNGQSYLGHNTTSSFNDTLTNAAGCDSIITINLTTQACAVICKSSLDFTRASHSIVGITATNPASTNQLYSTNGFTWEAWVKLKAPITNQSLIMSTEDPVIYQDIFLGFGWGSIPNALSFLISDNGASNATVAVQSSQALTVGTWYHIAAVCDYNNAQLLLYLNGSLIATQAIPANILNNRLSANRLVQIGNASEVANGIDADIDEVQFWNTARTQTDIQNSINQCISLPQTGLVAYFKADENTGTTTYSAVNNNFTGTLQNTGWSTSVPTVNCPGVSITDSSTSCSNFNFKGFISNPASITSWQWYFDDGTTASGQNIAHHFSIAGNHTIKLIVTNTNGCSDSTSISIATTSCISTSIKNIINTYTPVLSFDPCKNTIEVEDASTFNAGDTVLLIQMKGAVIDSSNTALFGTVTNYRNTGNYEFNYVKSKIGNAIEFKNSLSKNYDIPDGKVQLIRVPYYDNITVDSTLTCLPWDGSKGGVLVLNVKNTIDMQANIDVTGKGFRGGIVHNSDINTFTCGNSNYYYPINTIYAAGKGEGIADLSDAKNAGKGFKANGGGGGVDPNTGGGGGGNGGIGGLGGYGYGACPGYNTANNWGLGGLGLNYNNPVNKIFMGGGGGAGHCNNGFDDLSVDADFNGGNGGGLVIINTNTIDGNNDTIVARGNIPYELTAPGYLAHDGMGGGGAGGTVLINTATYSSTLYINANGARGGNMSSSPTGGLVGPGGGGSGGAIWVNQSSIDPNLTISKAGGTNGVILQNGNDPYGATPGLVGINVFNLKIPTDTIAFTQNIDSVSIRDSLTSCNSFNFKGIGYTNTSQITIWSWSFDDGTTASGQNTSHSFNTAGSHTAKLIAADANGCSDSSATTVTSFSLAVDAGNDSLVCKNSSFALSGSGINIAQYSWTPKTYLNDSTLQNPLATINATTKFYLTATAISGCTQKDSVTISVQNVPVKTNNDTAVCAGNTIQLNTNGANSYSWSPSTGLTNAGIANPVDTSTAANTIQYIVTGTSAIGCSANDTVNITINPNPVVQTNNDTAICNGSFVQLNTIGANTYSWTPTTNISNPGIGNPSAHPTSLTQYVVTGTISSTGCSAKDSVTITINQKPTIIKSDDTAICNNTSVQLVAIGGTGYQWTPGATLTDPTINNPVASPIANTTYYVTITDANNCSNTDSVKVTIRPTPVFTVTPDTLVCSLGAVQLNASGGDIYSWTPSSLVDNPAISDPHAITNTTTTYTVHITESACNVSADLTTKLSLAPPLNITITKANDIDCSNGSSQLLASGADNYTWISGSGLNKNNVPNPIATPLTTQQYVVQGNTADGCVGYDSITVFVNFADNDNGYYVPSAFTPNGDGLNDCFGIKNWGVLEQFDLSIYNRWGTRIFHTNNQADCWDGTFQEEPSDQDSYIYIITATTPCGNVFRKGTITLIR